jgi:hypothetical protein
MKPSVEAQEILDEYLHPQRGTSASDLAWILVVAVIVVACWALDRHYEEQATEKQRIEDRQKRLAEPKFTEV